METFFLVWSAAGPTSPRVRHAAIERASAEAERLARANPGADFFVVQALSVACVKTRITQPLEGVADGRMPF